MAVDEAREPKWLGKSVKRKEDERFVRGKGNYVDDIKLPGMLHMSILPTRYAPTCIVSIDTSVAQAVPGVVAGLPEQNIRIISPDIGGGFGNKVPVYPGYVVATAASLLLGKPVKWVEDRSENLISTGFARDYHMSGEMALRNDGRMLGLRVKLLSDNGAFYADAQPTKFKAGLFHIVTGSYDVPAAHVEADGADTNKPPGGLGSGGSCR